MELVGVVTLPSLGTIKVNLKWVWERERKGKMSSASASATFVCRIHRQLVHSCRWKVSVLSHRY